MHCTRTFTNTRNIVADNITAGTITADTIAAEVTEVITVEDTRVQDKDIELAYTDPLQLQSDADINGGGLKLKGISGDKTILYDSASDSWKFNKPVSTSELVVTGTSNVSIVSFNDRLDIDKPINIQATSESRFLNAFGTAIFANGTVLVDGKVIVSANGTAQPTIEFEDNGTVLTAPASGIARTAQNRMDFYGNSTSHMSVRSDGVYLGSSSSMKSDGTIDGAWVLRVNLSESGTGTILFNSFPVTPTFSKIATGRYSATFTSLDPAIPAYTAGNMTTYLTIIGTAIGSNCS